MAQLSSEIFETKKGREVVIRSLVLSDIGTWIQFMNHLKTESTFTYQFPEQPEYEEKSLKERLDIFLNSKRKMIIGCFVGEKLIALADFQNVHHNENHPWIGHNATFGMGVVKDFWGEGIGFRLLQIMEREAKNLGFKQLIAEVRSNNEAGIQMYTKFGFEITGRKKDFAFINEKYYDDLLIQKKLMEVR